MIYTALEMWTHAWIRDEVLWFDYNAWQEGTTVYIHSFPSCLPLLSLWEGHFIATVRLSVMVNNLNISNPYFKHM